MNAYETIFIVAPTVGPDAYDRLLGTFEEIITTNGGVLNNTVKWGRRTLAYEVKKFKEGIYTIFEFDAPGEIIKEFERRMRLNDSILKFMTVKTDRKKKLEEKGSAQRKAKQDHKNKRRAAKAGSGGSQSRRSSEEKRA